MGRIGYRLNRLLTKVRAFHPRVFSWSGRMDNVRVRVPLLTLQALPYFFEHEPWMDDVLRRVMRTFPGLFVDVGMNIGQTLIKVKAIDPDQPVIGFEPNPNCLIALRELIRLNRYSGVRVVPVALSDTDGLAELGLMTGPADGAASMITAFREARIERLERIACLRFETVEAAMDVERLGVVKIDVEGAESMVIAGMEQRLGKDRPAVVVEILPAYDAGNTPRLNRQREIEAMMVRNRYAVLRLNREDPKCITLQRIHEIGVMKDMTLCNYVLCPEERVEALQSAFN